MSELFSQFHHSLVLLIGCLNEKAIDTANRAIRAEPKNQPVHVDLLASFIALGREKEAREMAVELLRTNPNLSVIIISRAGLTKTKLKLIASPMPYIKQA